MQVCNVLSPGHFDDIFREEIDPAEWGSPEVHGVLFSEDDGLTRDDPNVFFQVEDELDERKAVQRRGFAEEASPAISLLQLGLAEFAAEGRQAAQDEGEGLFVGEHECQVI